MHYLNSFGLVNGKIPAGQSCPFISKCKMKNGQCPSKNNIKENDYSCAAARAHSLVQFSEVPLLTNLFLK